MKNRYRQAVDLKKRRPLSVQMRNRIREGLFLTSIACAVFLFISLITYHTSDPGWSSTGFGNKVSNYGGRVGAWIADIFLSLFGIVAYLFPFLIVIASWINVQERTEMPKSREWIFKTMGWFFLVGSSCSLVSFYFHSKMPAESGGIVGDLMGSGMSLLFNKSGSTLVFITLLLFGTTLVTGLSWFGLMEVVGERVTQCWGFLQTWYKHYRAADKAPAKVEKPTPTVVKPAVVVSIERAKPIVHEEPQLSSRAMPLVAVPKEKEKKKVEVLPSVKMKPGSLPPLSLLNPPHVTSEKAFSNISFEALSRLAEQRLSDFGVEVHVVAVLPGPIITI